MRLNLPQVNKNSRIVLASILKPVDETRMFEKIGSSLAQAGHNVHIVGFPSATGAASDPKIHFHPVAPHPFKRLSITRFFASLKVLFIVSKLKPTIFIITTHELLGAAFWCKLLTGCKVLYDVQENYYRNIRYTTAFPAGIRTVVAAWVRLKERLLHPIITTYILAEKGYTDELPFAKPYLVLENKITKALADRYRKKQQTGYANLLFSGTLAETTGVFEAIRLTDDLHKHDASVMLTIIGHAPSSIIHNQLLRLSDQKPFIRYRGNEQPVPHDAILKEISRADFGIIWYPQNPSTACSIPTKLYEYMGLNLPVLISHNAQSEALVEQNKAGLILSQSTDFQHLIVKMKGFRLSENGANPYFDEDVVALIELLK
ncbi:MAG: glycosyltransferase [Cyclobacteriaceae bacterium]|nr:glycosyltransferase [Cyclobacteriaceae bacterium]